MSPARGDDALFDRCRELTVDRRDSAHIDERIAARLVSAWDALERGAFEQALATADAAGLAVWRLRALHQLGTIDMFDDARTDRLSQARRIADELGAASTGAVIDLQLTAVAMFRYELGEAEHHAQSAVATSSRLGGSVGLRTNLVSASWSSFLCEPRAARGWRGPQRGSRVGVPDGVPASEAARSGARGSRD